VVGDYDFIKFDYLPNGGGALGQAMFLAEERARFRAHMEKTGARYGENHSAGNCYICGARNIYSATFWHRPSNQYIQCGLECADNLECGDAAAFKKKVKIGLEAQAGKRKAKAVLEAAGLANAWEVYLSDVQNRADYAEACKVWRDANPEPVLISDDSGYGCEEVGAPKFKQPSRDEYTVLDMIQKLIKYGSLSEKQLNFMGSLTKRIAKAPEIAAARQAELDAALPIPEFKGRVAVKGKVLTVKEPDEWSRFGQRKMLVQHADGWKLWSSVPSSVDGDIARGDEIEFSAQITVSDKDPKFGFVSRPTKARLFKATTAVAA
jgi:hypothetical protein